MAGGGERGRRPALADQGGPPDYVMKDARYSIGTPAATWGLCDHRIGDSPVPAQGVSNVTIALSSFFHWGCGSRAT
eukprot:scaffold173835_cov27-Tisochrysis_lutea.AAC.1